MYRLLSLLILLTAATSHGQTFTLTEQDYDASAEQWKAPRMTGQFWRNAQGTYDSVYAVGAIFPHSLHRMYDWRKLSSHVRPQAYQDLRPYFLIDLKLNDQVPMIKYQYAMRSGDTSLWTFDSLFMQDSLLISHYGFDSTYVGQPASRGFTRYTYTERPEVATYVSYNVDDSAARAQYLTRERKYDKDGRLVSAFTMQIPNPTWRFDSALFEYDTEGKLSKATHYHIMNDKVVEILRHEYHGWEREQIETHPFVDGYTVAGGDDFDEEITYGRNLENNQDSVSMVRKRWYDQDGRVSSGYSEYYGIKYGFEISYYPNGDLRLGRNVTISGGDSVVRVTEYKNTYNGGRLHECIIVKDSLPFRRYEINYPGSDVIVKRKDGVSETGFGRSIEFRSYGAHAVSLVNMLGMTYRIDLNGSMLDIPLSFPSGLYFISIDGGKPRKHLIP